MDIMNHLLVFLAILTTIILFCIVVENLYWKNKDSSKMVTIKELLANSSLGFSYKIIDAVAIAVYVFFLYDLITPYGLNIQIENDILRFAVMYIVIDLGFWFTHFVMHKVRWFWTGHVTHHSSDRYNYSVALRQNLTVVFNGALLIWWIPAALCGFPKEEVLLLIEINLLYQFLLHTEKPSLLDKVGFIMNTPSHHRVHHGSNTEQIDKNFGGTFIIWDRIFGTFLAEKDAGEIRYGITRKQPVGYNPITLVFHEWKDMLTDFIKTKDIRVFTKPPGWVDQKK